MTPLSDMYWDSCVFYRYLTMQPSAHLHDIEAFLADAKKGECKIHCSTLTFAEIRPSFLKKRGHGSIAEFFSDLWYWSLSEGIGPF